MKYNVETYQLKLKADKESCSVANLKKKKTLPAQDKFSQSHCDTVYYDAVNQFNSQVICEYNIKKEFIVY